MEPTTRLRKAFKYPTDEDSDTQPEDLDEEEQEVLIKTFIDNDAAKTEAYKVYIFNTQIYIHKLTDCATESLPSPPNPFHPPLHPLSPPPNKRNIPPNPPRHHIPFPNDIRSLFTPIPTPAFSTFSTRAQSTKEIS
jgi:hypothetical protein